MIITSETLQELSTCAFLSKAAYLDKKDFQVLTLSDERFHSNTYHFIEDKKTDTQCHILIGESIYITYRGTENAKDAITDLSICRNSKGIHSGFYRAYKSVRNKINTILLQALQKKERKTYFSGHSLGGALALIHVDELPSTVRTQLITYGAPMVFNSDAAQFFMKPYYRVEYKLDPVPRLPSDKLGYVYARGQVLWIDLFNNLRLSKPWWADKLSVLKSFHGSSNYATFFKKIIDQPGFTSDSYISIK
jgi:hypothetical protein